MPSNRSESLELGKKLLLFFNILFITISSVFFIFITLVHNYKRPIEFQGPMVFYLIVTLFAHYISFEGIRSESSSKLYIFGGYSVTSLIAVVIFWCHEWASERHLHDWFLPLGLISIIISALIVVLSLSLAIAIHHSRLKINSYKVMSRR